MGKHSVPKPKLRCALFDHDMIVTDHGEEERAEVKCRRCGTEGPPQDCPWCDEPMTMIPRIDRDTHAECFGKSTTALLFGSFG